MLSPATVSALAPRQQQPDSARSGQYVEIGAATMAGGYTVITDSALVTRATRLLRRPHEFRALGVSAAMRRDRPNWGVGLRARGFSGSDHGEQRKPENGFISARPEDAPYTVDVSGWSALIDIDTRFIGVSGGVLAGHLFEGDRRLSTPRAAGDVRFGVLSQLYGEVAINDHDPAPVSYPTVKASVVVVGEGAATYRFGAANAGPFVEAFVVTKRGWLFDPFISAGESGGFVASVRFAKRFSLATSR